MQTMGGGHEGQGDNHKQELQARQRMQRKQNGNKNGYLGVRRVETGEAVDSEQREMQREE